MVRAGAGAGIIGKLEPVLEPHKNGPTPQHWIFGPKDAKRKNEMGIALFKIDVRRCKSIFTL
jgi:hypothetical protein